MDLNDFLGAQVCSWVRKSFFLDDLWKKELFLNSNGSVFNLRSKNFDKKNHPILFHIAQNFERFVVKFSAVNENFMRAFIFDNPCITFDFNRPHFLQKSFFTEAEWREHYWTIQKLTMESLIKPDYSIREKNEFETLTGIRISDLKFNKLRGMALASLQKFKKNLRSEIKTDTVQNFMMRVKKGSKRIRMILKGNHNDGVSQNILKYGELTQTVIDYNGSKLLNSSWGFSYLHNNLRTFIFKLHNNILGLNSRVAHFVRGHPRTCTFCDITREPEENSERILHLFYDCRHVENLLTLFYGWILNIENRIITRREFFVGFDMNCP